METRRLITALLAAMAVFFLYHSLRAQCRPDPAPIPETTTQPAGETAPLEPTPTGTQPSTAPAPPPTEVSLVSAESLDPVTLGGGEGDALKLVLDPRGAAVRELRLTTREQRGDETRFKYRAEPDSEQPYTLLHPIDRGNAPPQLSFATGSVLIKEMLREPRDLKQLIWRAAGVTTDENGNQRAVFETTLRRPDVDPPEVLRLTKTYELLAGEPLVNLHLKAENLTGETITVTLAQEGPVGVTRELLQYEMRRFVPAFWNGENAISEKAYERPAVLKATRNGGPLKLVTGDGDAFLWGALCNRFFGAFVRPIPAEGHTANFLHRAELTVVRPDLDDAPTYLDVLMRMVTIPQEVAPDKPWEIKFEIYAGAKETDRLALLGSEYIDPAQYGYHLALQADSRCCTFEPLPQVMTALLHWIHAVVPNYGLAIIVLVLIVRTLLHPLTVFQQKSMFRMQDVMARIQPKMQALKQKYANDKARQNQEMMKLFSEEGVNPMGNFVAFIPLIIQMPILVALWTALNSDIQLRHASFVLWIDDLSAPDALIEFSGWPFYLDNGLTIPILGWLISWFRDIPMFNLLPVLMGLSMFLQHKYMPKPGQAARREASKAQAQASGGDSAVEMQMRQQRIMGVMMAVLFPVMFYYFPSGLVLYWMATTVFGIGETLLIRHQLEREKERRALAPADPAQPRKRGPVSRMLKRLAEQAEEIQRKADEMSNQNASKKGKREEGDSRK